MAGLAAALVVAGLMVGVAWRNQARPKTAIVRCLLLLLSLAAASTALATALAVWASGDLRRGERALRDALTAFRDGNQAEGRAALAEAESAFGSAKAKVANPLSRPAEFVPVIGSHQLTLRLLATAASDASRSGSNAAEAIDLDAVSFGAGGIDLDAIATWNDPLAAVAETLDRSNARIDDANSTWLVHPVQQRLDAISADLQRAAQELARVRRAVALLPDQLGQSDEKRYLMLVLNPAEARGSIGIVGNVIELTADQGSVRLGSVYSNDQLNTRLATPFAPTRPADYVERYGRFFGRISAWQEVSSSPDFPSVATVAVDIARQTGLGEFDGVFGVDADVVARMIGLTKPVTMDGLSTPLTAENAVEQLLFTQYVEFDEDWESILIRQQALGEVVRQVWTNVLDETPALVDLATALGRSAGDGHLLLWSADADVQQLLGELRLDAALADPNKGLLRVVSHNRGGAKIDWFLRRRMTYSIERMTDRVQHGLDIELWNEAPAAGLPDYILGGFLTNDRGNNIQLLSVHADALPTAVTMNGVDLSFESGSELGRPVVRIPLEIPPTERRTIRLEWQTPTDDLRPIEVGGQPLAVPDQWTILRPAAEPLEFALFGRRSVTIDG
jgi:hypothetical protein